MPPRNGLARRCRTPERSTATKGFRTRRTTKPCDWCRDDGRSETRHPPGSAHFARRDGVDPRSQCSRGQRCSPRRALRGWRGRRRGFPVIEVHLRMSHRWSPPVALVEPTVCARISRVVSLAFLRRLDSLGAGLHRGGAGAACSGDRVGWLSPRSRCRAGARCGQ